MENNSSCEYMGAACTALSTGHPGHPCVRAFEFAAALPRVQKGVGGGAGGVGAEMAMDCVGGPFTRQMMHAVRPGGICYLFGALDSTVVQVQPRHPWGFPCSFCRQTKLRAGPEQHMGCALHPFRSNLLNRGPA